MIFVAVFTIGYRFILFEKYPVNIIYIFALSSKMLIFTYKMVKMNRDLKKLLSVL